MDTYVIAQDNLYPVLLRTPCGDVLLTTQEAAQLAQQLNSTVRVIAESVRTDTVTA